MKGLAAFGSMLTLMALAAAPSTPAELLSRRYAFRPGVVLDVGESCGKGLRLDSVRFDLPAAAEGQATRTAGLTTARIAVSNTGPQARRIGVAIALHDEEGRLLGVASGGTQLASIRAGRQRTFEIVFDGVNLEIPAASQFQISLEAKP